MREFFYAPHELLKRLDSISANSSIVVFFLAGQANL